MSDAVRQRTRSLAGGGEWERLFETLDGLERSSVAADSALAYPFGEALYHTGRMPELAAFAQEYEEASRGAADPRETMRALNLGGIAAFELGDTGGARQAFDTLMELAEGEGDEEMLARAANNLGAIANLRGRRHEALAYYSLAIPLYQKLDQTRGLAQTHHNLGLSYRDLGRPDDSVAAYSRAISLAESISYSLLVAMSTVGRAEIELRRGDVEFSRRLVDRGLALSRNIPDPISEAEALRVRGLAHAADGASDMQAQADLAAALRLAGETGNRLLEAEIERDMGTLALSRGELGEAERLLRSSARGFHAIGAIAEARVVEDAVEKELGTRN
jgi:tetratricopeptide (TPR) repeat protein